MNVCFLPIPLGRQVRFTTAQQGESGGKKCKKQTCGDWGEGKEDHQVSKQIFLRQPVEVLEEEAVVEQAFVCCLWRGTTVEQIHTMEPPRQSRGMCPEGNAARESPHERRFSWWDLWLVEDLCWSRECVRRREHQRGNVMGWPQPPIPHPLAPLCGEGMKKWGPGWEKRAWVGQEDCSSIN